VAVTIVVTGRGGTGKSSFAALASTHLQTPQLLIDADPDESLAALLGVDLAATGTTTISGVLYDIQTNAKKAPSDLRTTPLAEQLEYLLHMDCLYESSDFDMLVLGAKWTQGCYCHPNDILRAILPELAANYPVTIIDSPAGLEHLNRRIITNVGDIFAVMDPSAKSLRNVERVKEISEQIGINFQNLYLVANYRFNEEQTASLANIPGTTYLGHMPHDPDVGAYDRAGQSLADLPANSVASSAVRQILQNAGYQLREDERAI
jgi:CO dehydrogenase maturation factor